MDTLINTLVALQAAGAFVGVACVVWGEFAYIRAIRDEHVDAAERAHLDASARGLYFGMTLLLLASLGLVILAYLSGGPLQPAVTATYWSFTLLALLVTLLTWARSRGHISFTLGSAALFTGWWFLLYLALGRLPLLSLGASVALYVVATALFYGILRAIRHLI